MKKIFIILVSSLSFYVNGQNLFPVKLENCLVSKFCLDCGDIKVSYNDKEFNKMLNNLNNELNVNGVNAIVKVQVLVDSKGKGCVLSHTDKSNNPISRSIVEHVNKLKKWNPAITEGKKSEKTSVNLIFEIRDGKINGFLERVDLDAFKKSFDRPRNPEITNKSYKYKNNNLGNYEFKIWNSKNSNLPNNQNDYISVDKSGLIWLTVDDGLVTFDGENFNVIEIDHAKKVKNFYYKNIVTDNNNTKWLDGNGEVYSFDNRSWTKHDSIKAGVFSTYNILKNDNTNELFFCSNKGLAIYNQGTWKNLNKKNLDNLPSDRVKFAQRDSKNRLWIGTFDGSAMIDENNVLVNFEKGETVLKGKCITSMAEDENGNLYFSLYEFNPKDFKNRNEGIAVRYTDGIIKQLTTENSGLPNNDTSEVLYDKNEKVLWISTITAGLIRYDLNESWENYHNLNSDIPTSFISTMTFDLDGNLLLATRQGLVKIEKKK